jgi:RNA polymerase sigma-70 factor (ECF subfamily)
VTDSDAEVRDAVADAYRREWAQVLATTVRVAGDLDIAEECVQDAFVSALTAWGADGVPTNPGAWLTTVAKRNALDQLRRASTARAKLPLLIEPDAVEPELPDGEVAVVPDDRLRLVFTCCHPALAPDTQVALTLRLVCGLPTASIAQTFLVSEPTMAARITRGKKKISIARIPFVMPPEQALSDRLDAVLTVIHLFFTAGHTAASGNDLVDREVVLRAIELGRQLSTLLPEQSEVQGLLALMLMTDARRATRVDSFGELVLLADQDRSRWDRAEIADAVQLANLAVRDDESPGRFVLQAAIAAAHAMAPTADATDWRQIVQYYDRLARVWPTPVVELNRAAAIAMADGPERGLAAMDVVARDPALAGYHYVPAARADLLRRVGRDAEAAEEYRRALVLVGNDVERRFLQRRLIEVTTY